MDHLGEALGLDSLTLLLWRLSSRRLLQISTVLSSLRLRVYDHLYLFRRGLSYMLPLRQVIERTIVSRGGAENNQSPNGARQKKPDNGNSFIGSERRWENRQVMGDDKTPM